MSPYVVGQRFVSEAEPELGLGSVERTNSLRLIWLGAGPSRS